MSTTKEDVVFTGWVLRGIAWTLFAITGIALLCAWGCPQYEVYKQGMHGAAKLKEAESSRQILVQEAHAKNEAATDFAKAEVIKAKGHAQAEIEKAKGVAEANRIIGESLAGRHEYLLYLWIHSLAEKDNLTTIYVPTEAGIPLLEAGRFGKKGSK